MPIALTLKDPGSLFDAFKSVLVVPCGVCPKMCLAAEKSLPLIDAFSGSESDCYAAYIARMRASLSEKGVRTALFRVPVHAPMMCLWPREIRKRLARESVNHDAIAVIGCESAVATVTGAVVPGRSSIIQMAENVGIANFIMEFHLPFRVRLLAGPQVPITGSGRG
jgi:hypothetical protein